MRLKKLEILGFKSFADKVKLEFTAGITAVVGPNGCGKSNIVDAFRWVLGEQSAKSMRGHKMPDVIFAGTTERPPLNIAEVKMTLTEIDGKLPTVYEEVSITRRLHRSGESEYRINDCPKRLKDVQDLFLDTGMGKDAYAIFEQGKIDQVINLSPLERRYIFEEAAGILRFLQRKKEALRKLEQTEFNLLRVKDIHKEEERQIVILEQQAEKARQYKEDKRVLEDLEKILLLHRWNLLQGRLKDLLRREGHQGEQVDALSKEIESLQVEQMGSKQSLVEIEKELRFREEEVFKMRSTKEIKSKERSNHQDRIKDLMAKEKQWEHELEMIEARFQQRRVERAAIQQDQQSLEEEKRKFEEIVRGKRDQVKDIEEKLTGQRERQQKQQKEVVKLVHNQSQCENELSQVQIRLENAQEQHKHVQERIENLKKNSSELDHRIEEKRESLEIAIELVDKQKAAFLATETHLEEINQEIEKTQYERDKTHQEIVNSKARQKVLEQLKADMEGFSEGSKRLLQESTILESPLFGKIKGLYEYFSPEKGVEAALAAVLKPYAQALVVQTEADFQIVLSFIKKNQLKDIALICFEALCKMKTASPSHPINGLTPLGVRIIENEVSRHFLRNVYLSKEIKSPLEIFSQQENIEIFLPDGGFVDRKAVLFYATPGDNNVFMREAELKILEKRLREQENEKQQHEGILRSLQQKRNHFQMERAELDKNIRKEEVKLIEMNFAVQKLVGELEKMKAEEKFLSTEKLTKAKAIETLSSLLLDAKEAQSKANALTFAAQKEMEGLTEQLNLLESVLKEHSQRLREEEIALRQLSEQHQKRIHSLHVLEVQDLESQQQERRLREEIELGRSLQTQFEIKGIEVEKTLKEVEVLLSEVMVACKKAEEQVAVRKSVLELLEVKINEKRVFLKKNETEKHQIGIQIAQLESNSHSLERELEERYQLTIEALTNENNTSQEVHSGQIEQQIRTLRQQIETAGDVNMMAIEECEKHKSRYQFLNQQIDDLDLSKQELIEIVAQLDEESRKIFKETFEKIRTNFKKNFDILFSGGEADLQFTETSDVLEAGIEIIAKPPGKQMRSINLLSGGEKCLTAVALLFAIFEVKPAPFCILDEIDAPLDDTNVERFANIIRKFADQCQFIIITHNKRTMAIADVIFGISMEKRGISKVLGMNFLNQSTPQLESVG